MANRPNQRQMEALVDFLERNPGIAKGLLRTQQAKVETKRKWKEFAAAANALGGVIKDGPSWSKYWAEKKSALKRVYQQKAESMRWAGEGVDRLPELSELEQRIVAALGGHSFVTGDRNQAVDPLRNSSQIDPGGVYASDEEIFNNGLFDGTPEQILNLQAPEDASPQETSRLVDARRQREASQQAKARAVQSAVSRRMPRLCQQSRQIRRRALDTQFRRFEVIESRRVEAERQTAEALAQIASAVSENAEAQRHIAQAQLQIADALAEMAQTFLRYVDRRQN